MGCTTKTVSQEVGAKQGRQTIPSPTRGTVPQYPSKKSRAGPVTVTRFSQNSGSSNKSIVMSKINHEVRSADQEGMWPGTPIPTAQVTQGPRPRV